MICPRCNSENCHTTKYLPIKTVPYYAEFQPLESFTICLMCNFGGKTKFEMMDKESFHYPHYSEIWDDDTLKKYK